MIVLKIIFLSLWSFRTNGFINTRCQNTQYFDSGLMACSTCPANSSMVPSQNGFSCTCDENSIPDTPSRCKRCSQTEMRSSDGLSCVQRRCQKDNSGRVACRKCPIDYISVTQNIDGSPMKEVQCVKCSRGYKPVNNICVSCETCSCNKDYISVNDKCLPKSFVSTRPKYGGKKYSQDYISKYIKLEYLCKEGDRKSCQSLANECVKKFYDTDPGGPCRFWLRYTNQQGLPKILIEPSDEGGRSIGEIHLSTIKDDITIVIAAFNKSGTLRTITKETSTCLLPRKIRLGVDQTVECRLNLTELHELHSDETLSPFLLFDNKTLPLHVQLRNADGALVQGREWMTRKYKRYFVTDSVTTTRGTKAIIYLKKLKILFSIKRNKTSLGKLNINILLETQYSESASLSNLVTLTFEVRNDIPNADIFKSLEIWGGVLGAFLGVYGLIKCRGALRRGSQYIALVPLMAGYVADALYFTALLSSVHALAAEAGTLGLTLPLIESEEKIIAALVYSAFALKLVKVLWINWRQSTNDVFFLDWSDYNPTLKDIQENGYKENWRINVVAREWFSLQTKLRVPLGVSITVTLLILHVLSDWQNRLPECTSYRWTVSAVCWWCSCGVLQILKLVIDRATRRTAYLPKLCSGVGVSLFVFEEEYLAHYIHGRIDDVQDVRSLSGPLSHCRVVCAPQMRTIYRQLSPNNGLYGNIESLVTRKILLARFLAAFFERALDGMSWIASERTNAERLLDVELVERESSTSLFLYNVGDKTVSCLAVTWSGEEWSLTTFNAMLFGVIFIKINDYWMAAFITVLIWQILKAVKIFFFKRNIKNKTNLTI